MSKLLEIIGKKGTWEILVIIYHNDKVGFTELQKRTEINTRTLSRRLKDLVDINLLRRILKENRTVDYVLTEKGRKIVKILYQIFE